MERPGSGPIRFGPPDPDDLVGEASARLLAIGTARADRLTALRTLGLLADHTDADHRVRRPLADLAAEFELDVDDLVPALAALAAVEVLRIDPDRGIVLAAAARPSRDGLRLEAFLANVERSTPSPVPHLVEVGGRADGPVHEARAADRGAGAHDLDGPGDEVPTPAHLVLVHPAQGSTPWHRPIRAATVALAAAAAAAVFVIGPEGPLPTSETVSAASATAAGGPDDDGALDAGTADRRGGISTTVPSVRSLDGRTRAPAGVATSPTVRPSLDVASPIDPAGVAARPDLAGGPGPAGPRLLVPDAGGSPPPPEEQGAPPPPCAPLAPLLEVIEIREGTTDPRPGSPSTATVVGGRATNRLDRPVVLDGLTLRIGFADGTSRTVVTTAAIPLAAGASAPWDVAIPVGGGARATTVETDPPRWRLAGEAPDDLCAP